MLEKHAENLWTYTTSLRVAGLNLGARMTIVRLPWGALFLHSPVLLTPDIERILAELGTVQYIVAPNSYHHLFVRLYLEKFPTAQFWTVEQVIKKRPRLPHPKLLSDAGTTFVGDEILLEMVHGRKFFSEAVFLHVASKTLIVTDLVFNLPVPSSFFQRLYAKALGVCSPAGPSRTAKFALGHESHTQVAIHKILNLDFTRVIMAHGEVVSKNAKEILHEGFAYLL